MGMQTKDVVKKHYLKMGDKGEHVMWLQKALLIEVIILKLMEFWK